jgi:TonB-linked SusC/RagA family outer membrane protein
MKLRRSTRDPSVPTRSLGGDRVLTRHPLLEAVMTLRNRFWVVPLAMVLAAGLAHPLAAQQAGAVQGVVVDAATATPLANAQVTIQGTTLGTLTNEQGRFELRNVPSGTHTLHVQRIGYAALTREIAISEGQTTTANISLAESAVAIQELVVTGVSGGAMERGKVPFSVSRIDASQMPVQSVNPLSQLQGKLPGANIAGISGRPGRSPEVMLRGPTSINAAGRGQGPLVVVDGVVLGGGGLQDINPADIESVEVVKGAAASTLYGSRAASGVIAITTKRGSIGADAVSFTARSEIGFNDIEGDFGIARNHPLLMDETGTRFCVLDPYGSANVCSRTIDYLAEQRRINDHPGAYALPTVSFPVDPGAVTTGPILQRSFLAGQWPGTTYNAVEQIVDPKPLALNDVSMSGRVGATTFFSSVGHARQGGAMMGLDGYERLHGRVNLGHRFGDNWSVDVSSYISRSTHDGTNQDEGGVGFFRLTRTPAIVDITRRDAQDRLFIRTNLGSAGTQNENPLYSFENTRREDVRTRILGGATARYTPLSWLEADATFNVDRLSTTFLQFNDRGFRTTNPNPATNEGFIFNGATNNQSVNTSAGVLFLPTLTDWLDARLTLRSHFEQQDTDFRRLQGQFLRVSGVTAAENATAQQDISSSASSTRQLSFSAGTFLDFLDRYTFDFALRRDANSRFGEQERWQTYGRGSGAWLIAREDWFPTDVVSTFTVRASYGTAGNAPSFGAQYETFNIGAGGALSAATLGNPFLRPEVMRETEIGTDIELLGRFLLTATYANSITTDQILPVPVPVATGFPQQWQNAGDLRNRTWELSLDVPILDRGPVSWATRLNYGSTESTIERLNVAPFFIGTNLQATGSVIRIEEGLPMGTIWGRQFITSCDQLPSDFRNQCGTSTSAFQRNSDGYIVWVGAGNNPGMGISHNMWNAILPSGQAPWGTQAAWGMPILLRDDDGSPLLGALGSALPDLQASMSHTIGFGGFTLYGLFEGSFGRSVWNQGKHWAHLDFLSAEIDQGGRSIEDAKPIGYYYRAGPGTGGSFGIGGLYDILSPSNHMVEDASFIKLRELSLGYNIGPIGGIGNWTANLVGRNLKTWTDYSGFDPEVGVGASGGAAASGILNAIDAFTFPQLRTMSIVLQTTF